MIILGFVAEILLAATLIFFVGIVSELITYGQKKRTLIDAYKKGLIGKNAVYDLLSDCHQLHIKLDHTMDEYKPVKK